MLLQTYWHMLTENYYDKKQVGLFWCENFGLRPKNAKTGWGLSAESRDSGDISKAWRNHMMQPGRGFFSAKHQSGESLTELIQGFIHLEKHYVSGGKKSLREIAADLFASEPAMRLDADSRAAAMALKETIDRAGDTPMENVAALTALFWFCFSLRPAGRNAPADELPAPQNRYDSIMAYLYVHANRYRFHPEHQWVINLSPGQQDRIQAEFVPAQDPEKVIRYQPGGFENTPEQWQPLLELQQQEPDPFLRHYQELLKKLKYTSSVAGLMRHTFIPSAVPVIRCHYYPIDYRTHRTIEDTVNEVRPDLRTGDAFRDPAYGWLRTALGVNVIIEVPAENKILLHVRGESAEYGNAGKYYPGVVETIDLEEKNRDFELDGVDPVTACVTRGLAEELGFADPLRMPNAEADYDWKTIRHLSFARTLDFHQDNFFSIVRLNPHVTMRDIEAMAANARENGLEVRKVAAISSDPLEVVDFMLRNRDRMLYQTQYALWLYVRDALQRAEAGKKKTRNA